MTGKISEKLLESILGEHEITKKEIYKTGLELYSGVQNFTKYFFNESDRIFGGHGASQEQMIGLLFNPLYTNSPAIKDYAISKVSEAFPELEKADIDEIVLKYIRTGKLGIRVGLVDEGKLSEKKVEPLFKFTQQLAYDIVRFYVGLTELK